MTASAYYQICDIKIWMSFNFHFLKHNADKKKREMLLIGIKSLVSANSDLQYVLTFVESWLNPLKLPVID